MSTIINGNQVVDSTALAALVVPGDIAVGTKIYNSDVGSYFTYTISSASLVTDVVVAVAGITGARWIKDTTTIADGSVTTAKIADAAVTLAKQASLAQSTVIGRAASAGTGVPTALTATQLAAIPNAATTLLQGMMPAADKVKSNNSYPSPITTLNDADQTVSPGTLKCSAFAVPVSATGDWTYTADNSGTPRPTQTVDFIKAATGHTITIKNNAGTTMGSAMSSSDIGVLTLYWTGSAWGFLQFRYL